MKRLLAELEQEYPRVFANLLSAMRPLLGQVEDEPGSFGGG